MRVLFVGPFPWPSHQGSQAYLAGQATALARRGHEVHLVVYGAGRGGRLPGVTLHRSQRFSGGDFAGGGLHVSRPLHDLLLARRIRHLCQVLHPDVLHAHNVEGPLAATLARTGVPVVYDLHTRMEEELADHLPPSLAALGPVVGRVIDGLALAASDAGCAISPAAAAVFREAGLPHTLVGPGVDPDELVGRPDAAGRFGQGPHVVYTGNLDRYQNIGLFVDAVQGLDARAWIVTGSDDPVPSGVTVVRSRDFRDALDVLSVAQVAVIPREACSGFPIKLLNQLGMGVPTVMLSSAAVDLPGVVPCTPSTMHDTIAALLADPERRGALSAAARSAIRTHWTWDARMERLEALYARVTLRRACRA